MSRQQPLEAALLELKYQPRVEYSNIQQVANRWRVNRCTLSNRYHGINKAPS